MTQANLNITNEQFLTTVFGDANAAFTQGIGGSNLFSISTVDGKRRKENFKALHCIVVDDVGTKCDKPPSEPNWIFETSEGNEQWGYILEEPITHQEAATVMTYCVGEYGDGGAKDVVRLMKLPESVHSKKLDADGNPWQTKVKYWNPTLRGDSRLQFLQPYAAKVKAQIENQVTNAPRANNTYKYDEVTLIALAGKYDPDFIELLNDPNPKSDSDFRFSCALFNAGATVEQAQSIYLNSPRYRNGKEHGQATENHFVHRIARADFKKWESEYRVGEWGYEHVEWLQENFMRPSEDEFEDEWAEAEKAPDPLVCGLFDLGDIGIPYGDTGSLKTATMIDLAIKVAGFDAEDESTWADWAGRPVMDGGDVLYLYSEGGKKILNRFKANAMANGYDLNKGNLHVVSCGIPMDTPHGVNWVKRLIERRNIKPKLVIVDVLIGHLEGEINSSATAAAFYRNAKQISKLCGNAVVMGVSHVGHTHKDRPEGARQWLSLADFAIPIERSPTGCVVFPPKNGDGIKPKVKVKDGDDNRKSVSYTMHIEEMKSFTNKRGITETPNAVAVVLDISSEVGKQAMQSLQNQIHNCNDQTKEAAFEIKKQHALDYIIEHKTASFVQVKKELGLSDTAGRRVQEHLREAGLITVEPLGGRGNPQGWVYQEQSPPPWAR